MKTKSKKYLKLSVELVPADMGLWNVIEADVEEGFSQYIGAIYDGGASAAGEDATQFDALTGWHSCTPGALVGSAKTKEGAKAILLAWHRGGRVEPEGGLPLPPYHPRAAATVKPSTAQQRVQACGFTPPSADFTKIDSRGDEYGKWTAKITGANSVRVTYHHRDPADAAKYDFSMDFTTLRDFEAWSKSV